MNTIRCLIVIPLISLFVLSCVNRKMTGNIYDIFPESIDLHAGREVAIKGYLSTIGRMTIMDSIVIVQSYNSTHNFYAYNINTGTLVNKLVAYGRSNNESLWANMQNPYKDNFVMYDISKSVLGSIPLARIGDSAVIFDRIVVQFLGYHV
uniref:PQQ-binding-like beta-propeller repeat protein n=1 Tax=Odoribacter sp. AF15-53 TaxID=2292236 RepID=UPI000FF35DE5